VPFQVVDAEHRLVQRQTQAAGKRGADQQRAGQPRTLGVGDRIDLRQRSAAVLEGLLQQRNRAADVVARCQFRHHAAVRRMHRNLRVQRMRQQALFGIDQRNAGFVTGGFNA